MPLNISINIGNTFGLRACLKIPRDAVCAQTLRAAVLLAVGGVGSVVTARLRGCSTLAALPAAKILRRRTPAKLRPVSYTHLNLCQLLLFALCSGDPGGAFFGAGSWHRNFKNSFTLLIADVIFR